MWNRLRKFIGVYDFFEGFIENTTTENTQNNRSFIYEYIDNNYNSFENDELFWRYTDILREKIRINFDSTIDDLIRNTEGTEIDYNIQKENLSQSISDFWDEVVNTIDDVPIYLRYCVTYKIKSDNLYETLRDTITGFGDDGYSDVLDSFVLFGKERYEMAIDGEIIGSSRDQYQGENYIKRRLTEVIEPNLFVYGDIIIQIPDTVDEWRNNSINTTIDLTERLDNLNILYNRERIMETLI